MNKKIVALAVLGALSSVAFAESQITLYGVIDEGVSVSKTKGSAAAVSIDSGNWAGSRWGLKGTEDLGNGTVVGFQLEQGFSIDDGTVAAKGNLPSNSTGAFTRISRLYVMGDWGELGFGRWGSLSSGTGPYDMLYTWLGGGATSFGNTNAWDTIAGNAGRTNNSIVYVSPNWASFRFKAMYSNGMVSDTNQWAKNQHYYGLGLEYNKSGLKTALIFDVRDQKGLDPIIEKDKDGNVTATKRFDVSINGKDYTLTNRVEKPIYSISFGIGYDFEYLFPQFGYTWTQQSDVASQHTFGLSTGIPLAGGDFNIGVRYAFGNTTGLTKHWLQTRKFDDKYGLFTVNLYYSYPLSKRTSWYGYAGYTDGNKLYSHTGLVSNVFNGSAINTNGYSIQVGMKHTF